jgi:NitT/TauT family transport system permease protein
VHQTLASIRDGIVAVRSLVLPLIVGITAWELVGRWVQFDFLPPFSNVLRALTGLILSGQIVAPLAMSLVGLAIGYGLAVTGGVTLGLLMGRSRTVEYLVDPFISGFLAAPKVVFVPVMFALFGVSRIIQVAVVFLSAFFIIVTNTMSAVHSVDRTYIEMARSFGARDRQLFWKVLLPAAFPMTVAGLRVGMGRAVKGMINGEMFIALFGLGGLLRLYGSRFDSERVLAILLVVIGVALVCSSVVQTVERRLTRWLEPGP